MPLNDALPPPVAEEELKVFIAISVLAIGVPSVFVKLVAVIIPVALMQQVLSLQPTLRRQMVLRSPAQILQ